MKKLKEEIAYCSECGLEYVLPFDKREHTIFHKRYLKACERFGRILFYLERERLKKEADQILFSKSSSVHEKVAAVEKFFQAYFSRSVRSSGFNLRHPPFFDYCAMLLNQEHWDEFLKPFPEVHQLLLKKYGRKAGIYVEGSTNYPLRRR